MRVVSVVIEWLRFIDPNKDQREWFQCFMTDGFFESHPACPAARNPSLAVE
jgi:hypothetical protein